MTSYSNFAVFFFAGQLALQPGWLSELRRCVKVEVAVLGPCPNEPCGFCVTCAVTQEPRGMMGTGWMRAPIQPEPYMYRTVTVLPTDLSSQDLFRTNSRVNCDSVKRLTVRIFYNTGTILVRGNRCPRWREEFSPLIKCIRAVYAFVDRVKEPVSGICTTSDCRLFGHRRVGSQDYRMLDPGVARVHRSPGQPEVREGARVDFRPSVPSQPHLRQLQSRFPSQTY